MRKHRFLITLSFFFSSHAISVEPVVSNCSWKPSNPSALKMLTQSKEPSFCTQSRPDDCNELLVSEKGRTYLYSLPDQSCKSEIFIVYRDQVSAIDYYPDISGTYSNGNFVRIVYSSKQLNKEISGWVELKRLCRLNANGHCPRNNLKPKQ
jgi:hypothetical protein